MSPVGRDGARAGDRLYVTGTLGGPGTALAALVRSAVPEPRYRERFAHPVPRLAEGRWLAGRGARAMIDISDGLCSELRHLAAASGVAVRVDLDRIPCLEGLDARVAAASGEEYELLCAVPGELDAEGFRLTFGVPVTPIGTVHEGAAGDVAFRRAVRVDLGGGYDHFTD